MATGTVQVWSKGRGSGWIKPDAGGDRVYVHKSGVTGAEAGRAPSLTAGQRVEFQIGQRPKGNAAINVRPLLEESAAPAVDPAAGDGTTDEA